MVNKKAITGFFEKLLQSRILLYCVVFLLVLKIFTSLIFINIPKNIFFADITKMALVDMLNQARESSGLAPLAENQQLDQAAAMKAEDMIKNQYFSHNSPAGITPWYWFLQSGYVYKYAGENLAIGFYDSEEVYQAWLNSPSHKANMLNSNYKEVGTAVLQGYGDKNAIVVVQEFGAKQSAKTINVPVAEQKIVSAPQQKTTETPASNPGEKVLSQTTEMPTISKSAGNNTSDNGYSRFLNFIVYSYDAFLQNIIYGVLVVLMGIMICMIMFNSNFYGKKEFIFRSVLIIVLLVLAALINRELIISIIPHKIII